MTSEASSVANQKELKEDDTPEYSPSSASPSTSEDEDRPGAPEAFQAARVARVAAEAAVRAGGAAYRGSERLARPKASAAESNHQRLLADRRRLLEKGFYSFLCERARGIERELQRREDEEYRGGLVFEEDWGERRVRVVYSFLCERICCFERAIQQREDEDWARKHRRALELGAAASEPRVRASLPDGQPARGRKRRNSSPAWGRRWYQGTGPAVRRRLRTEGRRSAG